VTTSGSKLAATGRSDARWAPNCGNRRRKAVYGRRHFAVVLGIVAPLRLSALNRLSLKISAMIAITVNRILLALLFFLVVTPMALVMRITGKRPLRLAPDQAAASYWIERERQKGGPSTMRRQF
jgi:hypothetical protein